MSEPVEDMRVQVAAIQLLEQGGVGLNFTTVKDKKQKEDLLEGLYFQWSYATGAAELVGGRKLSDMKRDKRCMIEFVAKGMPLRIPRIVHDICSELAASHELGTEGLMRKSGNATRVKQLLQHIDSKGRLPPSSEIAYTCHDLMHVLKYTIRLLPGGLFYRLVKSYLAAQRFRHQHFDLEAEADQAKAHTRRMTMHLCHLLPTENKDMICYLCHFFVDQFIPAQQKSLDANAMTLESAAKVLGPTMFPLPPTCDDQQNISYAISAVVDVFESYRGGLLFSTQSKYMRETMAKLTVKQAAKIYKDKFTSKSTKRRSRASGIGDALRAAGSDVIRSLSRRNVSVRYPSNQGAASASAEQQEQLDSASASTKSSQSTMNLLGSDAVSLGSAKSSSSSLHSTGMELPDTGTPASVGSGVTSTPCESTAKLLPSRFRTAQQGASSAEAACPTTPHQARAETGKKSKTPKEGKSARRKSFGRISSGLTGSAKKVKSFVKKVGRSTSSRNLRFPQDDHVAMATQQLEAPLKPPPFHLHVAASEYDREQVTLQEMLQSTTRSGACYSPRSAISRSFREMQTRRQENVRPDATSATAATMRPHRAAPAPPRDAKARSSKRASTRAGVGKKSVHCDEAPSQKRGKAHQLSTEVVAPRTPEHQTTKVKRRLSNSQDRRKRRGSQTRSPRSVSSTTPSFKASQKSVVGRSSSRRPKANSPARSSPLRLGRSAKNDSIKIAKMARSALSDALNSPTRLRTRKLMTVRDPRAEEYSLV
eukprot:m.152718 g.152718  ORF g.152718 m.152718 type:complete len:764 (-) comp14270_c0_seq2:442-2733(-)